MTLFNCLQIIIGGELQICNKNKMTQMYCYKQDYHYLPCAHCLLNSLIHSSHINFLTCSQIFVNVIYSVIGRCLLIKHNYQQCSSRFLGLKDVLKLVYILYVFCTFSSLTFYSTSSISSFFPMYILTRCLRLNVSGSHTWQ